jgi:uncharacterized membrane protein YoaK (UPF0700 family)
MGFVHYLAFLDIFSFILEICANFVHQKFSINFPNFGDISAISWWILMQNSVLQTLLVVDDMTEIWICNLKIFVAKIGSKVEIC